ncbi:MAG: hypothetical protein VB934_21990 [Polyangiaceae bacterium]
MKKHHADRLVVVAVLLVAALGVRSVRSSLFDIERRVNAKHDVYFMPPPKQLLNLSLGYRAALADVLWAHVRVSSGLHTFERRRFENLVLLYDAINELAPRWRTPYRFADSLITFQTSKTPYTEVLKAREIMERGARNRPTDAELWLNLGEFVSYVAPASYLEDTHPEVAKKWRQEGIPYLARAAELGTQAAHITWRALGGANILLRAGHREAAIRFLKRALIVSEEEALKADIRRRLKMLMTEREFERANTRAKAFFDQFLEELPFIDPTEALVLGPSTWPARCAGLQHSDDLQCATTWRTWSERFDKANRFDDSPR